MKIFDCFTYFDEDLVLDIRLNILNKFVDKFIIVESGETHQGKKKNKNFRIENFKKFKNKIIYLYFDKFKKNLNPWQRESFQRNFINNGLHHANNEDLIIISDVDEIPNLENVNFTNLDCKFYAFKQKMFYYKLNLLSDNEKVWYGSRACRKKYLISPQWLRSQKAHKNYPFWRIDKVNFKYINNGGWHFTYLKDYDAISKKIKSFAHSEYNKPKYTNLENIKNLIIKQKDLFNRDFKYTRVEIDYSYPDYIRKNINKFKKWILK